MASSCIDAYKTINYECCCHLQLFYAFEQPWLEMEELNEDDDNVCFLELMQFDMHKRDIKFYAFVNRW